eukprot:5454206-Amphidinium_carterae.1
MGKRLQMHGTMPKQLQSIRQVWHRLSAQASPLSPMTKLVSVERKVLFALKSKHKCTAHLESTMSVCLEMKVDRMGCNVCQYCDLSHAIAAIFWHCSSQAVSVNHECIGPTELKPISWKVTSQVIEVESESRDSILVHFPHTTSATSRPSLAFSTLSKCTITDGYLSDYAIARETKCVTAKNQQPRPDLSIDVT